MNIRITRCTIADLTALQSVSKDTFFETFKDQNTKENMDSYLASAFTIEKLTAELTNPYSEFYFLYVDDQVAGYLKINTEQAQTEPLGHHTLEVERIYVLNAYQKKGIGKRLMDKAVELAKKQQKTSIWLGVWEKNANAIAFYERAGFVKAGSHSFYMGDEEQFDLIMTKPLQ